MENQPSELPWLKAQNHRPTIAMSKLSMLCVDVFLIIETFLDTQDIRNARLSGRELHAFLSPYLIKSIRFAPTKSCFQVIQNIATHPTLSSSVDTLCYDTTLFRLPRTRDRLDVWEYVSFT
jgi:hypothetical protein